MRKIGANGARPQGNRTALMVAAKQGRLDVMEFLLSRGALVDAVDRVHIPFQYAVDCTSLIILSAIAPVWNHRSHACGGRQPPCNIGILALKRGGYQRSEQRRCLDAQACDTGSYSWIFELM